MNHTLFVIYIILVVVLLLTPSVTYAQLGRPGSSLGAGINPSGANNRGLSSGGGMASLMNNSLLSDAGLLDRAFGNTASNSNSNNSNNQKSSSSGVSSFGFGPMVNTEQSVQSAIDTAQDLVVFADTNPNINPPAVSAAAARLKMYDPRLRMNTAMYPTAAASIPDMKLRAARLQEHLNNHFAADSSQIIAVYEGNEVVLRGLVTSDQKRLLAERVVKFEPGVSKVRNELVVLGF